MFNSFKKVFSREVSRIIHDKIILIGSVGIMGFCLIFFASLFNEGLPQKMPVGIVDLDNSSLSRTFIRNLDATQQVRVTSHFYSFTEARKAMQRGEIYGFVVLKEGFSAEVISNRQPKITFYLNDAYLIAGSLILKDITYMSELTNGAVKQTALLARGMESSRIMGIIQPISVDTHLVGNPWANYGVYLLTVLLPGIMQVMIMMLTVYAIGSELKYRTSKEWLETADNSFFAALAGKLLPQTILFIILGIITDIVLFKILHFPVNYSFVWMICAMLLFVVVYQAIGIFIIGVTPVLRDGVTLTAFYGLLGFTFAGFTFPIEQLPYPFRIFSGIFPIRHYFEIYVQQALYGLPIEHSVNEFLTLAVFLFVPVIVFSRLSKAVMYQHYPVK